MIAQSGAHWEMSSRGRFHEAIDDCDEVVFMGALAVFCFRLGGWVVLHIVMSGNRTERLIYFFFSRLEPMCG
jgi:hypothetical protein